MGRPRAAQWGGGGGPVGASRDPLGGPTGAAGGPQWGLRHLRCPSHLVGLTFLLTTSEANDIFDSSSAHDVVSDDANTVRRPSRPILVGLRRDTVGMKKEKMHVKLDNQRTQSLSSHVSHQGSGSGRCRRYRRCVRLCICCLALLLFTPSGIRARRLDPPAAKGGRRGQGDPPLSPDLE